MNKEEALRLKQEILDSFYREVLQVDPSIRTQASEPEERFERRFAVGHILIGKQYRVEIRIQRDTGIAARRANEFKEKYSDDVNIEVLGRIEIPSKTLIAQAVLGKGVNPLRERRRPIHIGLSVGHLDGSPGTLGAIVETKGGDAVLSASHVIAPHGKAKLGHDVFQPGRGVRQLTEDDRIGELTNFARLSLSGTNEFDAAIAKLESDVEHDGNKIPNCINSPFNGKRILGLGEVDELEYLTPVGKVGLTTHYTSGTITAVGVNDITVFHPGVGNIKFDNLIEIKWESLEKPFSSDGDSGSLVFIEKNRRAIGLHIAGGIVTVGGKRRGLSYACDLKTILDRLEVEMI